MHWCCDTFNKQFRIESEKFNLWQSPPPISNACRVEDDFDNSILHLKALINRFNNVEEETLILLQIQGIF